MGNLLTALVTLLLLLIGTGVSVSHSLKGLRAMKISLIANHEQPATTTYFGLFVFVMYGGFPFTVFSQLTTGPMLDVIAPEDKVSTLGTETQISCFETWHLTCAHADWLCARVE